MFTNDPDANYSVQPPKRKTWILRHKILTVFISMASVIVLCVAVVAAAGGGTTPERVGTAQPVPVSTPAVASMPPSPKPSPTASAVFTDGQIASIGDDMGTPEGTVSVLSTRVTTSPADPEFGQHPANGYFVVVHVTATADKNYTQGFDVSSLDFYANDNGQHFTEGDGNAYDALSDSESNDDVSATLAAGEMSSGVLSFDVSSPHGVIAYAPNLNGQPLPEWHY